jgi:hypothetical protein
MRHPGLNRTALVAAAILTAGVVTACDMATRIPPGGQQVRVVGTGTEVRLDPPTVHAGDVYLVMEGSAIFIRHSAGVQGEQSGPMSEDALARLAQNGDQIHTMTEELYPGYAGNVYRYPLAAGKYAFLPVSDEERPGADVEARGELCYRDARACAALPPMPLAVLEVLP